MLGLGRVNIGVFLFGWFLFANFLIHSSSKSGFSQQNKVVLCFRSERTKVVTQICTRREKQLLLRTKNLQKAPDTVESHQGSSWSLWGGTLQCDSSWCCWSPSDSGGPILEHRGSPFGADSVQQGQLGDVVDRAGFPGQSPVSVGEGQVFLVLPPAQLFLQLSLYLQRGNQDLMKAGGKR